MYQRSGQSPESFTTPAADLLADKSGEVFLALQESLLKARQSVEILASDESKASVVKRLATAFDAAERILASAREAQLRRS